MNVNAYVWKDAKVITNQKSVRTQNERKMIDMGDSDLLNAYQHCKDMLYNNSNEHPGRYLVLEEISKQIIYCNAELAVRWFLSKINKQNNPIYTRFSIILEIQDFLEKNPLPEQMQLSDIKLKDIYSGIPADFSNVNIEIFLKACKELLGKFNRSHITQTFIINMGIWFAPDEIKTFEVVERLTTMEERINTIKERLNLNSNIKIPIKSTGLNYTQFRSMINLRSNKKYTELTTVQLETLRDKVLFLLEENVHHHINQWETLMSQIEEVCNYKGIKM